MLEPDHERSGKIDSSNQNQREMREHRHIRGFSGLCAAARPAECDAGQP